MLKVDLESHFNFMGITPPALKKIGCFKFDVPGVMFDQKPVLFEPTATGQWRGDATEINMKIAGHKLISKQLFQLKYPT